MVNEETALESVFFDRAVAGPKGRSCNSIGRKEVDSLTLVGDLVYWEKGDSRVYVPLANVVHFTVAG